MTNAGDKLPNLGFRTPLEADWVQILRLANESVAHLTDAVAQGEWLANRRSFPPERARVQFVAVRGETVVGYAAMEAAPVDKLRFRLFVVTSPAERASVGSSLLDRLLGLLHGCAAEEARFVEYAGDAKFLEFLVASGFVEGQRILLSQNTEGVAMVRRASFA